MKKILVIAAFLSLLLSLVSCGMEYNDTYFFYGSGESNYIYLSLSKKIGTWHDNSYLKVNKVERNENELIFFKNDEEMCKGIIDIDKGELTITAEDINYTFYSDKSNCRQIEIEDMKTLFIKDETIYGFYPGLAKNNLTITGNAKIIDSTAFQSNNVLTTLIIESGIDYIETEAFMGSSIQVFDCKTDIDYISEKTFYNCENLKTVNYEYGLKEIGVRAFYNCDDLTNLKAIVTKENGIIGREAFYNCKSIFFYFIPNTVEFVDRDVFYNYEGYVLVGDTVENEAWDIDWNNSLSDSKFEYNIDSYGIFESLYYAKRNDNTVKILKCDSNTPRELIIPDTIDNSPVTEIGYYSFKDCRQIVTIIVNQNVKKICKWAFIGCDNLNELYINSTDIVLEQGIVKYDNKINIYLKLSAPLPSWDSDWESSAKVHFGS